MSKGQHRVHGRGRRQRGFEDDGFSPFDGGDDRPARTFQAPPRDLSPAPSGGGSMRAVVKMFNEDRGFGFVALDDGSGDAFLHINVLQSAGFDAPQTGTTLEVQVGQGQKGPQVTAVISVDASTAGQLPARSGPSTRRPMGSAARPDPSTAVPMDGVVKWFNPEKGFGFVQTQDGGRDVFVHISVLQEAGLATLADGAEVSMGVVETPKGREAVSVSPRS